MSQCFRTQNSGRIFQWHEVYIHHGTTRLIGQNMTEIDYLTLSLLLIGIGFVVLVIVGMKGFERIVHLEGRVYDLEFKGLIEPVSEPMNDLPEGVVRCREAIKTTTLEDCDAIQFHIEAEKPTSIIVWKDGPKNIRPFDSDKPLRDLRPGDKVWFFDRVETVKLVEIYR